MATGCLKDERAADKRYASPIQDSTTRSTSVSIPAVSGDVVHCLPSSNINRENDTARRIPPSYLNLAGQERSLGGTAERSRPTMSSARIEDQHLRGVGAQFDDQRLSYDRADLIHHMTSDTERHACHPASPYRVDMDRGSVQAQKHRDMRPMERFILEASSQQPAIFVKPSTGQLSIHGGYGHRSSPSTVVPQSQGPTGFPPKA